MSTKPTSESGTSNLPERITAWAYIGGFISLLLTIAIMGKKDSPYTWVPVVFLVADVVGGIAFAMSKSHSTRLALAVAAILLFMVSTMDALTRLINAITTSSRETRAWLDALMYAQPDVASTVGQISLGFEIVSTMVLGIIVFVAVAVRNKNFSKENQWDPKHAISLVLVLYALSRGMVVITLVMAIISLGFVGIAKSYFQDGAKAAEAAASKRGWNRVALFITAAAFIVAAFIFTPLATWVGGIAVIYSAAPFTTLTFVVTGIVIGGWYAL